VNATLRQLYQDIVLEHHAHPRHAGPLATATHQARVDNPLCGDRVTLQLRVEGDRIAEARFEGDGCAISIASASLLTAMVTVRRIDERRDIDAEQVALARRGSRTGPIAAGSAIWSRSKERVCFPHGYRAPLLPGTLSRASCRAPEPESRQDLRVLPRGEHQNFASSSRSLSAFTGGFTLPERISAGVTFRA